MRIDLWTKTIRMIADHPLLGVGLGNFRQVFETRYNPELNNDLRRGVHAHNLWLHKYAELGLIGGTCYLALWVTVLWMAWRQARGDPGFVAVGLLLGLLGMAACNLTSNMFYLTGYAAARLESLTWVLFGLVAARAGTPTSLFNDTKSVPPDGP
jgi:O-antigen ligase